MPGAEIEKSLRVSRVLRLGMPEKKLGQAVAYEAMDTCMELADEYGIGQVAVDNTFHYLWGGGYALYAAKKGVHCVHQLYFHIS